MSFYYSAVLIRLSLLCGNSLRGKLHSLPNFIYQNFNIGSLFSPKNWGTRISKIDLDTENTKEPVYFYIGIFFVVIACLIHILLHLNHNAAWRITKSKVP